MVHEASYYERVRDSGQCACGGKKRVGAVLCFDCWNRLPISLHLELYKPIGCGFEQAYDAVLNMFFRKGGA